MLFEGLQYKVWRRAERDFWAASYILYNYVYKFSHICACLQIKIVNGGFVLNHIFVMTDSYCNGPNYSDRLCQSCYPTPCCIPASSQKAIIYSRWPLLSQGNLIFHDMLFHKSAISFSIHMSVGEKEEGHTGF